MNTLKRRIGQCLIAGAGLWLFNAQAVAESLPSAKASVLDTIKDGKLFSGEVAVLNSAGKITGVIVGSLSGKGAAGDALDIADLPASLTLAASVPNLKGSVGRLSGITLEQAIVNAIGADANIVGNGQTASGVLPLDLNGIRLNILPVGKIVIDTSRFNGVTVTANGQYEVVTNGIVMTFVAAVADMRQFAIDLAAAANNAGTEVRADGVLVGRINGVNYVVQPGLTTEVDVSGANAFSFGVDGLLRYRNAQGDSQILYPAFADLDTLRETFSTEYPGLTITANNGSVTAALGGNTYILMPDYTLSAAPADQTGKSWWSGADGKFYIRNKDGSAQGFTVK